MEEQRNKAGAPGSAIGPEPETTPLESMVGIPEEADEIIEIVDDPPPATIVQRAEPDFPEEALQQIRSLKEQLERKDKQIEQVMEAYRSKKTETEKQRGRIEKTERRRFEQSKGDFIARFVEVLDNLDRAIDSIEGSFDPDAVLQGIMLVRSRLVQLLKTEGLEKIFVRGETFDPMHAEAAEMVEVSDESQDGVVIKELQPGYMLKGSLLRPARVVVGQHGPPESTTPPAAESATPDEKEGKWETDEAGHELKFGDEGLDFNEE